MSLNRFRWLSQSLIGRMTVLSVIFLMLALGWFTVVPYWSYATEEPLTLTGSRVRAEVRAVTNDDQRTLGSLKDSALLKEVAAANERFRLYVRHGSDEVQFGEAPRYIAHVMALGESLKTTQTEPGQAYSGLTLEEEGAETDVVFTRREGADLYYEIGGIATPVASVQNVFTAVNPMVFWFTSKNPLIAGAGVLLIAFVVLLLAARSLRTLTRAVHSFDSRSAELQLLPVEGLPTEVASLVRAINEMIERVEQTHEEQELFLATAAHELRTPMAVLRTRLEELPDSDTKETLRDDLRRMSSLVDQLLRLMQIRTNRALTDEVDLVTVARDVVAERAPLSIDRGVDIELESEPKSLTVKGHAGLVGVAIANLVDNAISFSRPGDTLKVRVHGNGRVAVRDCGPGIPPSELERIFEPFAKNPPNRQGHGLGLAIVRAIMAAHGGEVSVRNIEGGGADFSLQFNNQSLPQPA
ncbi:MAG: HAMP domain-containing sensor histidine kinase [Gammaproteobacteria bacterium]|nr:HAMP domain-containing sensor histidine kinase [Gammaproteobacteria bacterium]MDE0452266.1 HAMP domain-containing sensor histidine kinase [Gammaproteobacteria bacterium]